MRVDVLFPTLIGIGHAEPATLQAINAEVLARKDRLNGMLAFTWGDAVLSSFEHTKNVFETAGLKALQAFVEASVLEFVGMTRSDPGFAFDQAYSQSWINVTRRLGFQERHNHERAVEGLPISGVYYFQTNGQDGDLAFYPSDSQFRIYGSQTLPPEAGKLVLFRSEVFHRVSPNLTDSDRISFAFNYLLRRPSDASEPTRRST